MLFLGCGQILQVEKNDNIVKGSIWMVVGATAIWVGATVLTCGVATPVMMAIAGATAVAGTATTINGASEISEAITGHNFIQDTVFQGNEIAYSVYATSTAAVAELGTIISGSWLSYNAPRIKAYNTMENYNVKEYHLMNGSRRKSKFNTSSMDQVRQWGKQIIRDTPMNYYQPNSIDSYKTIYDFGHVVGTKGQTMARLVFAEDGKIITFFPN